MTEEMEELFSGIIIVVFLISILALIAFAHKKNIGKDAIYCIGQLIVILLIGCFIPEPYIEYFFALIATICIASFPALYFGLIEISKGRLKWVITETPALTQNEKKDEHPLPDNGIYIKVKQTTILK